MDDVQRLHELTEEMSKTKGHLTRWRRICAGNKAVTVQDKIACAEEALSRPHSGSWCEGLGDAMRIRDIQLREMFGGEIPDDI